MCESVEEADRKLTEMADKIILDCNTWIHVAETRADITPPIDCESFRIAKMHAEKIKQAVAHREPIPREWMDSMAKAFDEGCRQR